MDNNKTIDVSWAKKSMSFLVNGKKVAILFEEDYDSDTIYQLSKKINPEIAKLSTK
jgi:metal-dependent hydrolase (beta-lactamase superfamily II)